MSTRRLWSLYNFIRIKCFGQTELIFYRILMDFQSNDEPLWTYLESQNKHIINRMTSEHENAVKRIEGMSEGILLPTLISRYIHSGSAQYPCIGFAWTTRTTDCGFTTAGKAAG